MKIKLQNKVIDLSIIESMVYQKDMLTIEYNNGRILSFAAERPEETIIIKGDSKEVQTFIHNKKQELGLSQEELKEKYALRGVSDKVYAIFDMEKYSEDFSRNKIEFAEKVDKIMEHWNEYQHDHVMML